MDETRRRASIPSPCLNQQKQNTMTIENIILGIYAFTILGFVTAYTVVLGYIFARPVKAFLSFIF